MFNLFFQNDDFFINGFQVAAQIAPGKHGQVGYFFGFAHFIHHIDGCENIADKMRTHLRLKRTVFHLQHFVFSLLLFHGAIDSFLGHVFQLSHQPAEVLCKHADFILALRSKNNIKSSFAHFIHGFVQALDAFGERMREQKQQRNRERENDSTNKQIHFGYLHGDRKHLVQWDHMHHFP